MVEAARNLRTAERYLLAPPLAGRFGAADIAVCDISAKGARFRHARKLETGSKALLEMTIDGRPKPVSVEAVIVWTQQDAGQPDRFVSGARTYAEAELMSSILTQLQTSHRTSRIEESRSTDRFFVTPAIEGWYGDEHVLIDNVSARGARIATREPLRIGTELPLRFSVDTLDVAVGGTVRWSAVRAVGDASHNFHGGLLITEKPELLRLVIGHLCEQGRAALDTQSLRLKLKILRARARQFAPSYQQVEASGIPAEQYLLIQGVREELRLNPEEAMHWYRRARISINDPAIRSAAPEIASHPDALAVWEYLDRSVDPTIVGRAFELP